MRRTHRVANCERLVQSFWPLTTQWSSRAVARHDSDDRSLPVPGSEKPWHHTSSPRSSGGSIAADSSGGANVMTDGPSTSGIEYTPDRYHTQTFQNGQLLTALATTSYVISPASAVSLITGISKEHAAAPDFSNLSYRIGIGYQRELPFGISLYLQPDLVLADYVAPSPLFGTTRRDRLVRLQLTLSKRDLRLWSFVPSLTYNFADNLSNQPLFSFVRNQLIIGLSKAF